MWKDIKKAEETLQLCRNQKASNVNDINIEAERYYENRAQSGYSSRMDPSKVLSILPQGLPYTNLIPFGMRVWTSVFMGAPFSVETLPSGARITVPGTPVDDPMGGQPIVPKIDVKKKSADAMNHVIHTVRQSPDHRAFIRRLGTQAMLYNQVAIYDGLKPDNTPYYQIVGWRDFYVDPAATEPINEYRGPSMVAVRLWLREDEVSRVYGNTRMRDMKKGLPSDGAATSLERKAFADLYPVIHWWGIDTSVDKVTRAQTRDAIEEAWQGILSGKVLELLEGESHDIVVEEGDKKYVRFINESVEGADLNEVAKDILPELDKAFRIASDSGMGSTANAYASWRMGHVEMGMQDEGGTIERYRDGIYRVEFQEDADEPLVPPEETPYFHGQIPISTACRHEGTSGYFIPGILAEALEKQAYIQYLEKHRDIHLHFQARPFFYGMREMLPARYRDPSTGEAQLVEDLTKGLKLLLLENGGTVDPSRALGWIQPSALSMDIQGTLREKKAEMMELFGASEVMRGLGPGAEASGKHIELKMQAASRPSSFMMHLLEGPIHRHFERYVSNVMNFAPQEWLAKMCEQDQIEAIMMLRKAKQTEMTVKVNLGTGMPTEWVDRFGIYMELVNMGVVTPIAAVEELGIPLPPETEPPPMAVPPGNQQQGQKPPVQPQTGINKGA